MLHSPGMANTLAVGVFVATIWRSSAAAQFRTNTLPDDVSLRLVVVDGGLPLLDNSLAFCGIADTRQDALFPRAPTAADDAGRDAGLQLRPCR